MPPIKAVFMRTTCCEGDGNAGKKSRFQRHAELRRELVYNNSRGRPPSAERAVLSRSIKQTALNHSGKFDTHLALQQCAPTQPARVYARITSSARCFATVHKLSATRAHIHTCVCVCARVRAYSDERPAEIILESRCEQDAIYIFNGRERSASDGQGAERKRERGGRQERYEERNHLLQERKTKCERGEGARNEGFRVRLL